MCIMANVIDFLRVKMGDVKRDDKEGYTHTAIKQSRQSHLIQTI